VFGYVVRVQTDGIPYAVFVFAAQVQWLLFSRATLNAIACLQEHMALVSKVSFPRLILPFASVFRDLFDATILVLILTVLGAAYGYWPTWRMLALPPLLLGITAFAVAIGLWLAGTAVRWRDIRPISSIALQIGFYLSPVLFPASMVPEAWRTLYSLNPMYLAIEGSRWVFVGQPLVLGWTFGVAVAVVAGLFVSGLFVFAAQERAAVDVQ
jgi:lipopolysaccharide transport system permease protein